jgi:hypothetical protein
MPFLDEIWVFPDGSYEYCPNPERRFGDKEMPLRSVKM